MNLQEFESQTRGATHSALDQLQSVMLLAESLDPQLSDHETLKGLLESQVLGAGDSIKTLTAMIESFLNSGQNLVKAEEAQAKSRSAQPGWQQSLSQARA